MVEQAETEQPRPPPIRRIKPLARHRYPQPRARSDGRERPLTKRPPAVLGLPPQVSANRRLPLLRDQLLPRPPPHSESPSHLTRFPRRFVLVAPLPRYQGFSDRRAPTALLRARGLLQGVAFQSAIGEISRARGASLRQLAPHSGQLLGAAIAELRQSLHRALSDSVC